MTRIKRNPCPVANCTTGAKPGRLMCWPHWRRVPKLLRNAVWDTFGRYSRLASAPGTFSTPEREAEFFEAKRQYHAAADGAVAAVEEKERAA
jgi:hypothetical protein